MGKVTRTGWMGDWTEEVPDEGPKTGQETGQDRESPPFASTALQIAKDIPKNRGRQEDGSRLPCRPRGTTKQQCLWDKAIIAILSHGTISAAAAAIDVENSTLSDWLCDPEFLQQLNEVRRQGMAQAILSMQGRAGKAVDVLFEIIDDERQPGATRHSAAKTVLEVVQGMYRDERAEEVASARVTQMENLRDELQLLAERSGEAEERSGSPGGRSEAEAAGEGVRGGDGPASAESATASDQ